MTDSVLYSVAGYVATITFNRPAVMNALDAGTIRGFCAAAERAAADTGARVVVLNGVGPAFVAGGDVAMFAKNLPAMAALVPDLADALNRGILALRHAPKPVIASVHGAVAGAGFSIMLACDLVLAAADTQFSLAYARIGASPDGGATFLLPRLAGYQRAMELMLLADTVDAAALAQCGVINRVLHPAELAAETAALARRLAAGPAKAYAETKALANQALLQQLPGHLDAEAQAFARCAGSADFAEGVTAFTMKRKPLFKGA